MGLPRGLSPQGTVPSPKSQRGYLLITVVVALFLVATIAVLLTEGSAINANTASTELEDARAEYVAQAGMQHALWRTQNNACMGDVTIPATDLGPDSYSATVDADRDGTAYALSADQDAWIRSDNPTNNQGTSSTNHIRQETGLVEQVLTRFDLAALPANAQINSAVARFYLQASKEHPEGPVTLHEITADWGETTVTWDSFAAAYRSAPVGTIPPQATGGIWVEVNLTGLVQAWVNGQPNHGILMQTTSEGIHTEYSAREDGANAPQLTVVVGSGQASPVTIKATSKLDTGVQRKLKDKVTLAYQPPGTVTLQLGVDPGEDAMPDSFYSARNYGGAAYVQLNDNGTDWQQYPLIRFDLGKVPRGAAVRSAQLELHMRNINSPGAATIHQVTRSWVEGTKSGGGTADGASWFTYDGTNAWASAGGDFNPAVVAETAIDGSETWVSWDVAPLVRRWLAGDPNYGLMIRPANGLQQAEFSSKEDSGVGVQPKLTIEYACQCGSACMAPQGSGNILMAVVNPTTLVASDAAKKALFESWGYTVNVISESANATTYATEAALNDVVFISETVNASQLGSKLVDLSTGVVSQDGDYNADLGIADNSGWVVGKSINIIDTSHYITAVFPAGPLAIYMASMEQLTVSGSSAAGLETLADTGGVGSLVALDTGASLLGGGTAAGRRVMLPLGRQGEVNWDYINGNGQLLVQRAIDWAMGADKTGNAGNVLLVVVDPGNPTAQEQAKKALMESWDFTVNLIDESDSQASFDAALTVNDVAYVPVGSSPGAIGSKLTGTTVGIVNEEKTLLVELGFTGDVDSNSRSDIVILDNTHSITSGLALGTTTITTSNQPFTFTNNGSASGAQILAETNQVSSFFEPSLLTLETNAELWGGGFAAGRRVALPWGDVGFDINALNADGLMIMQRAIEWGAGAGVAKRPLLFVVSDSANPTADETAKNALIETWGYVTKMISDSESQATFDAYIGETDVVYVSGDASASSVGTKLTAANVGVVNEQIALHDELGFSSGTGTNAFDKIVIEDNTHSITTGYDTTWLTVTTSSQDLNGLDNTLAPGLQTLGTAWISGANYKDALAVLDAGAELYDSSTAAGRRAQIPWGSGSFDFSALNENGKTIMRRAIEWGAGIGAISQTILFVTDDASDPPNSLSAQDNAKIALMESWGFAVTPISDHDTQTDFDTAISGNDVAYISQDITSSDLGTKLTNATIGVVNEEGEQADELDFSGGIIFKSNHEINVVDNSHYITENFTTGFLTFTSSDQSVHMLSGQIAPGLQTLGETLNTGSQYKPSLATLDPGDQTSSGGSAAGRRVELPWGGGTFDINLLNDDGRTIMRRAIEWGIAGGSGGGGGGGGGGPGAVFEEFTDASASSNVTSLNIAKPGGTAAGDLLIAALATDGDSAPSFSPPSGWTPVNVGTSADNKLSFGVWWKIATSSEPSQYTFTWSGGEQAYGWVSRFTGHDPGSPIYYDAGALTNSNTSAPICQKLITPVDDMLVLRLGGFDDDDITIGNPGLDGHTAINMDESGSGANTVSGGSGYMIQGTAGDTGFGYFQLTNNEQMRTVTLGIRPAP